MNLSSSFRKNNEIKSLSRRESQSNEKHRYSNVKERNFIISKDEYEIRIKILTEKNKQFEDEINSLKNRLEQEKKNSRKIEENYKNQCTSNRMVNIKDLEILKEKLSQHELENQHITFKHGEEIKKISEKFLLFIKVCKKYLLKLKNIYAIFSKIESKNIKSVSDNKDKIIKDINIILNDFDNSINDPAIINDLKNKGIDYKLYEILDKNDEDHLLKLFNFIDIIGKLETNNKKLQEQNDLITIKLKQDTIHFEEKYTEEFARLQRKIIDEKLQKEECENSMLYIKELNKDLDSKVTSLEQENIKLKRNIKAMNDKTIEIDFLKTKCAKMENEIRYKESIIIYLENILKTNKISDNVEENYFQSICQNFRGDQNLNISELDSPNLTNKKITFKGKIDSHIFKGYSNSKDNIINNSHHNANENNYLITLDPENKTKTLEYSSPIKRIDINHNTISYGSGFIFSENNNFNSLSRNNSLKNEIDNLDMEIKVLQNKLKIMIDEKKN